LNHKADRPDLASRERLLTCGKFEVQRYTRRADGRSVDVVVHPGGVVILPVIADGRIALIRNVRLSVGEELLELPAGTLEPGEDVTVCAARELEEETGYRAGRIAPLTWFYTTPGFCDERLYAYIATELTPGSMNLDPTEDIHLAETSLPDALEAIRAGRIIDCKTIAVLLHYHVFVLGEQGGP
jgi:ADP-ribose pyrophosphatase